MRTVGTVIKDFRNRKKISLDQLEKVTKIKKTFLAAIENESWGKLPEYPVVRGFVRSIAGEIDADREQLLALLRRDYPPKSLKINPNPDVAKKFVWSPRLSLIAGTVAIIFCVSLYLIYQYVKFISPPRLEVATPQEGQLVTDNKVKVEGVTWSETVVYINNQPEMANEDGAFSTDIEVSSTTEEIRVVAISRNGKETVVTRKINVKLD